MSEKKISNLRVPLLDPPELVSGFVNLSLRLLENLSVRFPLVSPQKYSPKASDSSPSA